MAIPQFQITKGHDCILNAMVYVNCENIFELLKVYYHKDPLEIGLFRVIQSRLAEAGFKVMDFIVYGNFEKKSTNGNQQTFLQAMGFQTCHASNNGKNSGDLELTVDALKDLYRKPNVDIFVIISRPGHHPPVKSHQIRKQAVLCLLYPKRIQPNRRQICRSP
jgi:hypothetical protein